MNNSILAQETENGWQWLMKRNCSISPYQLAGIFLGLGIVSMGIGLFFYLLGATLILPYSFLEITVLLIAFFYNARHANDFEKLLVEKNTVTVVSKSGSTESTVQLSRSFVRVELPSESKDLIVISQGKMHAYFGSHVHANLREALGREIMLKV